VNDDVLLHLAKEFHNFFGISNFDFKLSNGWLQNFNNRHGIACCYLHGESGDVDENCIAMAFAKYIENI
jgi:hypothetical protein